MKKNDLILVIDMQNAYGEGQPWACMHMKETAEHIAEIVRKADETGCRVIFTQFIADEKAEYTWKRYNEINREVNENPWMNDLVDDLKPYAKGHELYQKSTYSSLRIPEIRRAVLETNKASGRVILTGVVDDCCVLSTFFDALDDGAYAVWIRDAAAGISEEKHHSAEVVVEGLAYCHCSLMNTDEYLQEKEQG